MCVTLLFKCSIIFTPNQELNHTTKTISLTIRFRLYKNVSHFTVHEKRPFEEKLTCVLWSTVKPEKPNAKFYSRKYPVLMETSIYDLHEKLYITSIQNMDFHFPHVRILGTHQCGRERRENFKYWDSFKDVLCWRDYTERVVAIFKTKTNHNIMEAIYL